MGDNRGNSLDSRSDTIGFVDTRRVLGKVVCRVLPFEKFGTVN
jgi:signal peptidase I